MNQTRTHLGQERRHAGRRELGRLVAGSNPATSMRAVRLAAWHLVYTQEQWGFNSLTAHRKEGKMIDRYSEAPMCLLWEDDARYGKWLEVELAVCRAMEQCGEVPQGTADLIAEKTFSIKPERILQIEAKVHHDVIAFLTHFEELAGEPARWLHFGMTSSDMLDTAFALQLREAGWLIVTGIDCLMVVLKRRAQQLKDVAMIGRTHGMHAEPTSMGLVFAGYYAEMQRHRERMEHAIASISVGKIAGAVGVYGALSPEIERIALASLDLIPETCATQVVQRDRHAEYFSALAGMASSLERMATQIRHWQRSEVGEATEPFDFGQKGSSAMPHKRNPILSENICGLARLVRSYAGVALENVALWHERDISHSSAERVIAPDATILVDFMLQRIGRLMANLTIDHRRVMQNLMQGSGLVFSESVMLALVKKGQTRQQAYELVRRNAFEAMRCQCSFESLIETDGDIMRLLAPEEIRACFDLQHHLRHVDAIFKRVFGDDNERL